MIITNPPAPTQVTPTQGGGMLQFATFDITNWNMDTDQAKQVAHNLPDLTKVCHVSAVILNDAGTVLCMIGQSNLTGFESSAGRVFLSDTVVQLNRDNGGDFDNASYSGTGYRGRIYVTLVV